MPTYEFRCPQGHEFEKFYRSISGAEARATCPLCGQPAERIMSAAGFAFKGSGFYLTDYGKNAHRGTEPATGAPSGDGAAVDSKGDAKGDTKGDSKSESKSDAGGSGGAAAASGESSPVGSGGSSPAGGGDAKPAAPKSAEAKKPASPPKKSSGE